MLVLSSNTWKRIISSLALFSLVGLCFFLGRNICYAVILIFGILGIDEIFCQFFKRTRSSFNYFLSQALFIFPFFYFVYLDEGKNLWAYEWATYLALLQNLFLAFYLFFMKMESEIIKKIGQFFPWLSGFFFFNAFFCLASLFLFENWINFVSIFLLVVIGMDIGAWFFGKNFGSRKLWAKVSPKKTIEGLTGGAFTSGLIGCGGWFFFFNHLSFYLFGLFAFLGLLCQVGDLAQSKMKRQVGIKDSSEIIPGHGGVFDRLDGLLFVAPFFIKVLQYLHV